MLDVSGLDDIEYKELFMDPLLKKIDLVAKTKTQSNDELNNLFKKKVGHLLELLSMPLTESKSSV